MAANLCEHYIRASDWLTRGHHLHGLLKDYLHKFKHIFTFPPQNCSKWTERMLIQYLHQLYRATKISENLSKILTSKIQKTLSTIALDRHFKFSFVEWNFNFLEEYFWNDRERSLQKEFNFKGFWCEMKRFRTDFRQFIRDDDDDVWKHFCEITCYDI